MTQSEIGARIGVPQMQIFRVLSATLPRLRRQIIESRPPERESWQALRE
jgi:DNA-directed RNA polymerase specialized sigma subunit